MKVLKYPVIAITVCFASGILAGSYMGVGIFPSITAAAIAFLLAALTLRKANSSLQPYPFFGAAVFAFSFCLGMASYSLHYAPNHPGHYTHSLPNEPVLVKGIISERLKPNDFSEKYFFEITSVNRQPASGKLLVTQLKDAPAKQLHAGDILIIADELRPVTPAYNPYQFDYAQYMAGQNVFHQVKLKDNYIIAGQAHNLNYYIDALRNSLIQSFAIHNYSADVINVIKALLLGQRQDMDKETSAGYTDAGVIHILAISGLHIAVLFFLINILLRPLERFGKKGKIVRLVLLLSFLWLFAFVSGLSASVVRSVVMFSFVSIGLYLNRNSAVYNSIAVSMLLLLLAKPMFLFDVGFQLSYAAVLSIVWLQPVYKKLPKSRYRAVNYITDTVLISLVAQIGVLPFSLYYFNQFPLLFLVSNLVVIPLSTIILSLGIVVLFLNFTIPALAIYVGKILGLLIETMNSFIAWIASFKSLVIKDIPFTLALTLLLYTVLIAFGLWLYKKCFRRTAAMLSAVIAFQVLYMVTSIKAERTEELVVFHNWNSSLIAVKKNAKIKIYCNDTLAPDSRTIKDYLKGNFNSRSDTAPLGNLIWFNSHKILILDSTGAYNATLKPDVLILTQSSRINLERALDRLNPKQVVADATNFKNSVSRWQATCQKRKIPFHATAEKGFYKIK